MSTNVEVKNKFIESWGAMASVWGVNNSTARVHALLLVSEKPLGLDDIANGLKISRGNASMSLKELRSWGVVKLKKEAGDRRDYYVSENDAWKMFFAIAKERKRREFDPMVEAVEDTLRLLREETKSEGGEVQVRLRQMEELLSTLKLAAESILSNEQMAQTMLPVFLSMTKEVKQ